MGMILSTTNENPLAIKTQLKQLKIPANLNQYQSYAFVLPDKYFRIPPMLEIKRNELFGPRLVLRAFTEGQARHAGFVIPWEKELVIMIGVKNDYFGLPQHRWLIKTTPKADNAAIMALTYYLVGQIQEQQPPYYQRNIKNYCQDYGPKAYGKNKKPFNIIVPGSKS